MLIEKKDLEKLNEAGQRELTAHNMYQYLANCAQKLGYLGSYKFFLKEAKDEAKHYRKIADFANDRGAELEMLEIPEVDYENKTLKDIFQSASQAEIDLEKFYVDFYKSTSDVVLQQFLLSMIEIQRVSVGEYMDLLATLNACGSNEAAVLSFDLSLLA
jgi:ferritin